MDMDNCFELTVADASVGRFGVNCTAPLGTRLKLRITVPRSVGTVDVRVFAELDGVREDTEYFGTVRDIYGDDISASRKSSDAVAFAWTDTELGKDRYEGEWKPPSTGLYYLRCDFTTAYGVVHREYQFTVYRKEWSVPTWLRDGIMYQIFPDRFARSERHSIPRKPYAQINEDWYGGIGKYAEKPGDAVDNNEFFGGDLYGISEKLDHLCDLGVTVLYLNPVFEAHSNHRYDIGDYMKVDSMLGGDGALETLIEQCTRRGIRVILDGVFNHTGSDSVYFNSEGNYPGLGAAQSKSSEYYGWYSFGSYPDDYDCWWGVKILPTLNKRNAQLRSFIAGEDGVVRHWLKKGVSGWRLDVADELPDSLLAQIKAAAAAERSDSVIIGEVWEDASNKIAYGERKKYFQGYELDSVMNYPLRQGVIELTLNGDAEALASRMRLLLTHYPEQVLLAQMNFLSTHDTERIICALSGADVKGLTNAELAHRALDADELSRATERVKFASALMYCLPGMPCIYYGDEVGMEGWRDPFNRRPFPWGRGERGLYEHYRRLGKLRHDRSDLRCGETELLYHGCGVVAFRRGELKVVANRGGAGHTVRSEKEFWELMTGERAERAADGGWEYTVPSGGVAVLSGDGICGKRRAVDGC